ncbi:hypothetical protein SO802_028594 [Lithocarpus litseifolius]|uniref:F-box domain-containing protein n=1 Tax=Lithocarpus litseifolius TaxID=425828 RepID=A0AAW2BQQ7_9ROSI
MRQQNFAEDGDLLNNVPDSIVHRILCFLDLKDRSRLSCVSRRYRELCISAPNVALSNANLTRRFRFNNFVDRLLSRRSWRGEKIQKFFLHWSFGELFEEEMYRIDTWLYHVVNLGVQYIAFQLITERFALPQCVLNCKSLVTLFIKTNNGILKLPSTSSAPGFGINTTLQALALISVRIEDDDCFGEWISQFKSLKELNLTRVSGKKSLSIHNSSSPLGCGIDNSLKKLTLDSLQIEDDCFGEWLSHFKSLKLLYLTRIRGIKSMSIHNSSIDVLEVKDCNDLVDISIFAEKLRQLYILWYPYNNSSSFGSLKISAPNLENFRWGGHVVDYYCRGDFSHKLNLAIDLSLSDQLYESSTKYYLHKILYSMQRAKVLTLRDEFVEVLFKYGCLPYLFDHLEHLAIVRMSSFEDKIPALSSFLKETINLKRLVILNDAKVANSMPSGKLSFKLEYWESQNFMFTNQLKIVIMELSWGSDVELMKYLLKNTKELEEASIISSPAVPTNLIIELKKIAHQPIGCPATTIAQYTFVASLLVS